MNLLHLFVFAIIAMLAAFTFLACARAYRQRGTKLFANVNPAAAAEHQRGIKTFNCGLLADWTTFAAAYPLWNNSQDGTTAPAGRFAVVKMGADESHIRISAADTDQPIGICYDSPDAVEDPLEVHLLAGGDHTLRMVCGGAITAGAFVCSNGDGAIKTIVAGKYAIGRALNTGAAGDVIEVIPLMSQVVSG